jgi:hypothetical protein
MRINRRKIFLDGDEVVTAITHWLATKHGVHIKGARTVRVNDELCEDGCIKVDPSGNISMDRKSICASCALEGVCQITKCDQHVKQRTAD